VERDSVAKRWFTPHTARLALDAVRPAAETLCRLYRELECARPARILPDQRVDPAYFALVRRLYATLGEIRRRGVRVQDLKRGRLGFPARRAGRQVVLCWQVGEATLGYWHEPEDGVDGRRIVDEDGPWEET
jgi:hypothetical protein